MDVIDFAMEIALTDLKTIKEVQAEFHSKYPYLKLEFYKHSHRTGEASPTNLKVPPSVLVGKIRNGVKGKASETDVSIHGNMKVSTLEEMFQDRFGLSVQVFRKSGDVWLQTTKTDDWTLSEQNETAREFSELH